MFYLDLTACVMSVRLQFVDLCDRSLDGGFYRLMAVTGCVLIGSD